MTGTEGGELTGKEREVGTTPPDVLTGGPRGSPEGQGGPPLRGALQVFLQKNSALLIQKTYVKGADSQDTTVCTKHLHSLNTENICKGSKLS